MPHVPADVGFSFICHVGDHSPGKRPFEALQPAWKGKQ